jgi:site-specific recombinase XerC
MRRTKAAQIYRKTGNLRAVQLLLGHTKLESTVRYLGIEVDDALSIAEQIELVDHRHLAGGRLRSISGRWAHNSRALTVLKRPLIAERSSLLTAPN